MMMETKYINNDEIVSLCKYCKYNNEEHNQSNMFTECYNCVLDNTGFVPSKMLYQFFNKHGFLLNKEIKTVIILGFPGIGKTYLKEKLKTSGIHIKDSDSSEFDKSQFPTNYINYIKSQIGTTDILLCSTHAEVREAIYNDDYLMQHCPIYIVYPNINLKDEYIRRFKIRGNNDTFINLIETNWNKWITEISNENIFQKIELGKNEYLSHALSWDMRPDIYNLNEHICEITNKL